MTAWFFLLVTMTWDGTVSTTYVGPFPSEAACVAMRDTTARRVSLQQWIETATMEPCAKQSTTKTPAP